MNTLVLFDIDGTLVSGGPAKGAFHHALLETFGTAGDIENHEFSGKTDPQIARELLEGTGLGATEIEEGFSALWDRYVGGLEAQLPGDPVSVLPGVSELVEELHEHRGVGLGLVTGNIVRGARLKLGSAGLAEYFEVGSYGSDHEVRNVLPGIALERAQEQWDLEFRPDQVVVVGDTPRDVECGLHHGMRTVAVATGNFDEERLVSTGAHHVFASFEDRRGVLTALLG